MKQLERAIELKPEDPTINDHLGDAYWRIGRKLEAHFQWAHARDMKPDPEELTKIESKLKSGLARRAIVAGQGAEKGRRRRLTRPRVTTPLTEKAPAKINLTLRVVGRRADGYHELESLVVFAGVADTLSLQPDTDDGLAITGRYAAACGPDADNLVLKAERALRASVGRPQGRPFPAGEEPSGRCRHRRRLGRCRGGAAALGARQRHAGGPSGARRRRA